MKPDLTLLEAAEAFLKVIAADKWQGYRMICNDDKTIIALTIAAKRERAFVVVEAAISNRVAFSNHVSP